MTTETLITGGVRPAVRLVRHLPHPPEVVWRSLTDRQELRAWFPCDVIVDGGRWQVGAAIHFDFTEHGFTIDGEVLEVDEPHRLGYLWGEETLRFELTPHAGGTELVLIDELPAGHAARNAAGWEVCLDRLERKAPASDAWRGYFAGYEKEFTPILGPQEGPPLSTAPTDDVPDLEVSRAERADS